MISGSAVRDAVRHIPMVVEVFDHALIPTYEASKRSFEDKTPGTTRLEKLKKAAKGSAFPLALGAAVVGLDLLLTNKTKGGKVWWDARISEHAAVTPSHLLHVTGGALLGMITGTVEHLKPELVGHHRHGHLDHRARRHGNGEGTRSQRLKAALKSGLTHAGSHAVGDIQLLTVLHLFFGV